MLLHIIVNTYMIKMITHLWFSNDAYNMVILYNYYSVLKVFDILLYSNAMLES